jgi:eukaryotic-like serine/threonine-protein kinase
VNYRGNPQPTGVCDFPAIRELPKVKWQTRLGSTWLMPPLIFDGVLYTGGGEDGILYTLDLQTGEKLWATGGFGSMESTGVISGDIIVAGGYSNLVQALNRLAGEALWSFNAKCFVPGSPLIVDEIVYIATDHACYALDLHTE